MAVRVRVVAVPTTDSEFATEAQDIARRIPDDLPIADALGWYRLAIRRTYPNAVVREQEEIARVQGAAPVWYVTRREHHFRIDTSIWVPLPPLEAWHVYVDRVVEWQTAVSLRATSLRLPLMGREYEASYSFLGRTYQGVFRILSADPGRFVSVEASGSGIAVWYVTSFGAERSGSLVRVKGDYELPDTLVGRIADRLGLERAIARDIERANRSYRGLCTAEARRPAP